MQAVLFVRGSEECGIAETLVLSASAPVISAACRFCEVLVTRSVKRDKRCMRGRARVEGVAQGMQCCRTRSKCCREDPSTVTPLLKPIMESIDADIT